MKDIQVKEHKHMVDHVGMYSAGGHVHHSKEYGKHSAGHQMEHEKVKKLAKGGKCGSC